MEHSADNRMSRLCGRAMSVAASARESLEYVLEEMEYIAEANPEREDIKACVAEIKAKSKKALAECWAAANHWSEHFEGLSNGEKTDDDPTEKKPADDTDGD